MKSSPYSICKHCKQKYLKKEGHRKSICRHFNFIKEVAQKLNYELHDGSEEFLKDFYKIKDILYKLYYEDKMSISELEEKYGFKRGWYVLKVFEIERRNVTDALKNAIEQDRLTIPTNYQFHTEYHTSWENKTFFLRSSYESDYAKYLDEHKIPYEVEELKIKYWDSQKNIERIAIPDFYLPETNEVVEIKSNYTLDKQNMIDKFEAYKKYGYKPKLILEKTEVILEKI